MLSRPNMQGKPGSRLISIPDAPAIPGKPGATAVAGSAGTPDESGGAAPRDTTVSPEGAAAGTWAGDNMGVVHVAVAQVGGFCWWGGCGGRLYWWCRCCGCCCCWRCCSWWWWWERMGIVGTGGIIPPATGRTGTAWGLRAKAAAGQDSYSQVENQFGQQIGPVWVFFKLRENSWWRQSVSNNVIDAEKSCHQWNRRFQLQDPHQ